MYSLLAAAQLIVFLATLSHNVKTTEAAVIAEIKLVRFNNSHHKDEDGNYCDLVIFGKYCETLFEMKISDSVKTSCITGSCHHSINSTQSVERMDGIIDFDKDKTGLPSVMTVRWTNWDGGFQLFLEAIDEDLASEKDIIDKHLFTVKIDPQPNKTVAVPKHFKSAGLRQLYKTILTFTVKAYCAPNHFGSQCTKYCNNKLQSGQYLCNSDGSKQCLKGWYGVSCNIWCLPTKQDHFSCDNDGKKICNKGWSGTNCKQMIPRPSTTKVKVPLKTSSTGINESTKRSTTKIKAPTKVYSAPVSFITPFSTSSIPGTPAISEKQTATLQPSLKPSPTSSIVGSKVITSTIRFKMPDKSATRIPKLTPSSSSSLRTLQISTFTPQAGTVTNGNNLQTTKQKVSSSHIVSGILASPSITHIKTASQMAPTTIVPSSPITSITISSYASNIGTLLKGSIFISLGSVLSTRGDSELNSRLTQSSSIVLETSLPHLSSSTKSKVLKLSTVKTPSPLNSERTFSQTVKIRLSKTTQQSRIASSTQRPGVSTSNHILRVSPISTVRQAHSSITNILTNRTRLPGVKSSRETGTLDMQSDVMQGAVSGVGLLILLCIASLVYFKCRASGNKTQSTMPEKTSNSTKFIRFDEDPANSYPPRKNNMEVKSQNNPIYFSEGIMLTPCSINHTYDMPAKPVPDYCFVPPKSVLREKKTEDDCDLTSVSSSLNHGYANIP